MTFGFLPVLSADRHLGQRQAGLHVLRYRFDDTKVLGVALGNVSREPRRFAEGKAHVDVFGVQRYGVPELHNRAAEVAFFGQPQSVFIVLRGAVFRAVAGCQEDQRSQNGKEPEMRRSEHPLLRLKCAQKVSHQGARFIPATVL